MVFAGYESLVIAAAEGLGPEVEEFAQRLAASVLGKCDLPLTHSAKITVPEIEVTGTADIPSMSVESTEVSWALTTADWTNAAGNGSYVACEGAAGRTGAGTGGSFNVYLPRPSTSVDPNVRSGQRIAYVTDANGERICVSAYLDDAIGTIKFWSGSIASIPSGWALCDGSGITPNLRDRFIVGAGSTYAVGATGGSTSHSHSVTGSGDAGSATTDEGIDDVRLEFVGDVPTTSVELRAFIDAEDAEWAISGTTDYATTATIESTGETEYATTGITVNNATVPTHSDHTHAVSIPGSCPQVETGGTDAYVFGLSDSACEAFTFGASPALNHAEHTHTITEPSGAGDGHKHSIVDLQGQETGSGHRHDFSGQVTIVGQWPVAFDPNPHAHMVLASSLQSSFMLTVEGHTHDVDLSAFAVTGTAAASAGNSLPPYYALAYIMRVN